MSIVALCLVATAYGVGVGGVMLALALFVGPHMLIGAITHVTFGIAFFISAIAVAHDRRWGYWLTIFSATVVAIIGVVAVCQAWPAIDGVTIWSILSLFFLSFAAVTWRTARTCS